MSIVDEIDVPFALLQHVEIDESLQGTLGDPNQDWNWIPEGTVTPDTLAAYARTTPQTRTNTSGVADRGEYY